MLLNADDSYVGDWVQRAADKQIVRFSLSNAAGDSQYFASSLVEHEDGASQFTLHTPHGEQTLTTHFMGKHNVFNARSCHGRGDGSRCYSAERGSGTGELASGSRKIVAIVWVERK